MTTEHAMVYAKAFSSVPTMVKTFGNKSSSYVKLEQGVSKISKNGIEVVAEDLTVVKVGSSNNKNTVTQTGKNSKEVVLYEDKNSKITVDVKDVFIEDTGTTSNNQKVDVTTKTTEGKNKTTNTSSYVTGIKEDKPNTFLNGKKIEVMEVTEGKIGSIKELSTDEGISKLKNKTVEELHEIAEKEGLNPSEREGIDGTGIGEKFKIPNYDGKGKKIIGIRSDSGGTHNMDYIRIDTNQGSTKVIFGDPNKYKYNMTNKEKVRIIFINENKNKKKVIRWNTDIKIFI
jgi:hemolysin